MNQYRKSHTFLRRAWYLGLCLITLSGSILSTPGFNNNQIAVAQSIDDTAEQIIFLPLIQQSGDKPAPAEPTVPPVVPASDGEWTQDAHDAQRTGYTPEMPAEPWTLLWTWNGPDSQGGTGDHQYNAPRDARTVTGGNHVYVPAGGAGLYALTKSSGDVAWHLSDTSFNATPAYDPASGYLLAGGADGKLYKIIGQTGDVASTYTAGSPLDKSILLAGGYAYAAAQNGDLHKVSISDMSSAWVYQAGSPAATPPSFSTSRGVIIYATDDLYVHAVRDNNGSQSWRVKPTSNPAEDPYTFDGYWPVIAENEGIVFLRMNLSWDALWSGPLTGDWGGGVYPMTNAETRALLESNDGKLKNLFALDLDDGSEAFTPAVGFGGVEALVNDSPVLAVGPVPVIRTFHDGEEVAYTHFRSGQGSPHDGRWDSHMGEMALSDDTIPSLVAGDLRFVDFDGYVSVTDEQTPLTMAGDVLFHAHWGASEAARIGDRSDSRGLTHDSPIESDSLPAVIRRMETCSDFNPGSHWTSCGLTLYDDGRYWDGPGYWVYWGVLDPPTPSRQAYSEGILPRYTYVSDGLIIVEGNGGDLFVLKHSGQ